MIFLTPKHKIKYDLHKLKHIYVYFSNIYYTNLFLHLITYPLHFIN